MERLFKSILTLGLSLSVFFSSSAIAVDWTGVHVVERIQASTSGTIYFRPTGLGPWGGNTCPQAHHAYIDINTLNAETILNTAMASKLNGNPIYFQGTCTPDGNYILINYVILI